MTTVLNRLSKSSGFPDKVNKLYFQPRPVNGTVIKLGVVIIAAEKLFSSVTGYC